MAGACRTKEKQGRNSKRLEAEACAVARAGGFSLQECSGTEPTKSRKPTWPRHTCPRKKPTSATGKAGGWGSEC